MKHCKILFLSVFSLFLLSSCSFLFDKQEEYTITFKYIEQEEWIEKSESYTFYSKNAIIYLFDASNMWTLKKIVFKGWDDGTGTTYPGDYYYHLTEKNTVFTAVYNDSYPIRLYYPKLSDDKLNYTWENCYLENESYLQFSNYFNYDQKIENDYDKNHTFTGFTVISSTEVNQYGINDSYKITEPVYIIPNIEGYKFSFFAPTEDYKLSRLLYKIELQQTGSEFTKTKCDDNPFYIPYENGMNFWSVYKLNTDKTWEMCHYIGYDESFSTIPESYLSPSDSVVLLPSKGKTLEECYIVYFHGAYTEELYRSTDDVCKIWNGNIENTCTISIRRSKPSLTLPTWEDATKKNNELGKYEDVYITSDLDGLSYFKDQFYEKYDFIGWQTNKDLYGFKDCKIHTREEFLTLHSDDTNVNINRYPYFDETKKIYKPGETILLDDNINIYGIWQKKNN